MPLYNSPKRQVSSKGAPTTAKSHLQALLDQGVAISTSMSDTSSISSTYDDDSIRHALHSSPSYSSDGTSLYSDDGAYPKKALAAPVTKYRHVPAHLNRDRPTSAFDVDPSWIPEPTDRHCLRHSEFGWDEDARFRYTSRWLGPDKDDLKRKEEEPGYYTLLATYVSFTMLIVIGHLRDFIGKRTHRKFYANLTENNGYAPLNSDFDSFYTRRLKTRIDDLFNRPVTGVAGRTITLIDRQTEDHGLSFHFTGTSTQAFNISSYNYLGFAQSRGGVSDTVETMIHSHGLAALGSRAGVGTLDLHRQAEALVARFLGVEDAMVISMGFATNSTTLPALVGKGSLIISDELNHSSIRFGVRLSGAMVRQLKHNDVNDLERLLREVISQGQPRTHRPWHKILLVVEGLYSMEGTLLNLPGIMKLKDKYKFYIFVDEAHSIGALGPNGRGVCDYFGIDPTSIDILMGTFTKSFGSAGGYVAGRRDIIGPLRTRNHSAVYAESMSPVLMQQIIASMASIMGPEALSVIPSLATTLPPHMIDGTEGRERLRRLAFNARFLSTSLRKLGFMVEGHRDSPIIPILIFNPGKFGAFSRLMLQRHKIAVVVVCYPATPIVSGRARFCVSAAHTVADMTRLLRAIDDVGETLGLHYGHRQVRNVDALVGREVELVAASTH